MNTDTNQKLNVFVDCCTGVDDPIFISILIDLYTNNKNLNIVGISASYGKNSIGNSQANLNHIIKLLDLKRHVEIYKGATHAVAPIENTEYLTYGNRLSDFPVSINYPNITGDILMNKIKTLKGGKFVFISLSNLTCLSNLLMEKPQLRQLIDKFICAAGTFDGNFEKEMNIFSDPNAANHIFQDPIMKKKALMFPIDITGNFKVDGDAYKRLKYNGLNDTKKNGYLKSSLLKLIDNNIGKITLHNLPVLICITQYLNDMNSKYQWDTKEHKMMFKTEEPQQGRVIVSRTIEHGTDVDNLLKIEQQESLVVYGMDYANGWKEIHRVLDTVDNNYTASQTSYTFANFKVLSLLILSLSFLLSFINR